MLKFALAAVLLGATLPSIADDNIEFFEEAAFEDPAFFYIGLGSAYLFQEEYQLALASFENALLQLQNPRNHVAEVRFFAHFGQTIAYDNLGRRDKCEQALGALLLDLHAANGYEDDEDDLSPEEDAAAAELLTRLALLAKSPDLKGLLLDLIADDDDE